jgi:putative intracellular protease/amidase
MAAGARRCRCSSSRAAAARRPARQPIARAEGGSGPARRRPRAAALVTRHVAFEDLGAIEPRLVARGLGLRRLDAGIGDLAAIEPATAALVVVPGGPVGDYETDRCPWIDTQLAWLRRRLQAGRPTLGLCLGAWLDRQSAALTDGPRSPPVPAPASPA